MTIKKFNLKPDSVLNKRYQVINRLGKGYEGEVYRVVERSTKIERAAKLYYPDKNINMKASKMYAKKLFKLKSCRVVVPYHSHEVLKFRENDVAMILTDYIEGQSLTSFISKNPGRRLNQFQAIHLLHALATGLSEIKSYGEYHGDLHSDNIIVSRFGLGFDLKFLDFYNWDFTKSQNMKDDLFFIIRIFYDSLGGQKYYQQHSKEVKEICCGLKKSLILKRFKNVIGLRHHLENLHWS